MGGEDSIWALISGHIHEKLQRATDGDTRGKMTSLPCRRIFRAYFWTGLVDVDGLRLEEWPEEANSSSPKESPGSYMQIPWAKHRCRWSYTSRGRATPLAPDAANYERTACMLCYQAHAQRPKLADRINSSACWPESLQFPGNDASIAPGERRHISSSRRRPYFDWKGRHWLDHQQTQESVHSFSTQLLNLSSNKPP